MSKKRITGRLRDLIGRVGGQLVLVIFAIKLAIMTTDVYVLKSWIRGCDAGSEAAATTATASEPWLSEDAFQLLQGLAFRLGKKQEEEDEADECDTGVEVVGTWKKRTFDPVWVPGRGHATIPCLVIASIRDKNVIDTSRLKIQLVAVANAFPVDRAHCG